MGKLYTFILLGCFFKITAQNVAIPDPTFKDFLVNITAEDSVAFDANDLPISVDSNGDGEIQFSEAQNVKMLIIQNVDASSVVGIEAFTNLVDLVINYVPISSINLSGLSNLSSLDLIENNLTSLDLAELTNLIALYVDHNNLTHLDVSMLTNLTDLHCNSNDQLGTINLGTVPLEILHLTFNDFDALPTGNFANVRQFYIRNNNLTSIDFTGFHSLEWVWIENNNISSVDFTPVSNTLRSIRCGGNPLTTIDVTMLPLLWGLDCRESPELTTIFAKNGSTEILPIIDLPNLEYICADEADIDAIQQALLAANMTEVALNSYCSFVPGGEFSTVQGNVNLASNDGSCNALTNEVPNFSLAISDGLNTGIAITNHSSGSYTIYAAEGTHTITPVMQSPYFTVSPASASVTFPGSVSEFTQNFCISPSGVHSDVEISILPLEVARPGFDCSYKIIIRNIGTEIENGIIQFEYNDNLVDFVSATPLATGDSGSLNWTYENLLPFQTRDFTIIVNANSPIDIPSLNSGDVLAFSASIVAGADETPNNNVFILEQEVVNSFDPNDKTCLEGSIVGSEMIGEYVHYLIRFENTGTFFAENIVVKDMIDLSKFEISTLVTLSASHPFTTRIYGNKVEFIFEGIMLPFDDASNDGYVAFKIKTLPTLAVGDTFSNSASIFFDYNFQIITNEAITAIQMLGSSDFSFSDYFTIYPNPAAGIVNFKMKQPAKVNSISVYNMLGQIVLAIPNARTISSIDVSQLKTGSYFLKINSDRGITIGKFVKN
ncbi:MAG: T9SS type A sorting domain-containing protein [Flavobacterium sp.]|nr:T9SS type A sorting domain-containing protein [Flavobacterium sp.]